LTFNIIERDIEASLYEFYACESLAPAGEDDSEVVAE
jgi:hypothetical protein